MSVDINTSRSAISKDLGATVISGNFLVYNEKNMCMKLSSLFVFSS